MSKLKLKKNNREPKSIVFAKQNFTALEKDIIYHVINQLPNKEDVKKWPKDKLFTLSMDVKTLHETNYARIKTGLKNLVKRTIDIVDDENKSYSFTNIFPNGELKNGVITVHMHPSFLPSFTELKIYSVYSIHDILSLKGIYAKRIFEMFGAYINKRDNIFIIESNLLKKYLDIENKYKQHHAAFDRDIIKPAIEQINTKTSIIVKYERKRANKITNFTFTIQRKKEQLILDLKEDEPTKPIKSKPKETKQAPKQTKEINEKQKRALEILLQIGFENTEALEIVTDSTKLELWFKWKYSKMAANMGGNMYNYSFEAMSNPHRKNSFEKYLKTQINKGK